MTADARFVLPAIGAGATPVRFPAIARDRLDNGLRIWSVPQTTVPVVSALLVVMGGAADDPRDRPGLAGAAADLLDEAAGVYDAIQLADAFARLGTRLAIDVGSDVMTMGFTAVARQFAPALGLLGDVVIRPRFAEPDLARVRDLRLSRLRQLSSVPGAAADRLFFKAIFGDRPYGHGVVGTTRSLTAMTLDEVRAWHAEHVQPADATLIVAGNLSRDEIVRAAQATLGAWRGSGARPADHRPSGDVDLVPPVTLLVARPGASQSEVRVGHAGPSRHTAAYHRLLTLNAVLGGQFSSRLNTVLREKKGLTYGAHTAFDFRRMAGAFVCETSVQADGTGEAIRDILAEYDAIRADGAIGDDELSRAKASLTRGYVRHFETADQLTRACAQLVTYGLDDDTFDRFVGSVEGVSASEAVEAARTFIHPDRAAAVVIGDPGHCQAALESLGRSVTIVTPEF
ncbi:MAG: M16 family metallopeptidase [Vicinamibacterales bacterium]